MNVDRCVCRNVTFAELLRLAKARNADLPELSRLTGCGTSCGMCRPYIRVVLLTGRTELPPMPEHALEAWAWRLEHGGE